MYKFGLRSEQNLTGVHPALIQTVRDALSSGIMDFSVTYGVRTKEEQQRLYDAGRSQTLNSKHLKQADGYGHAVDLAPYPIDWDGVRRGNWANIIWFGVLYGLMAPCAKKNGIELRWGGDWDGDGISTDHVFLDAPHFEIRRFL